MPSFVRPSRAFTAAGTLVGFLALGASALLAGAGGASARSAQAKALPAAAGIAIDYGITLAGLSVGTAQVTGRFEGARYKLDVSARLTGLAGVLTGGAGAAQASGSLGGARPVPSAFAVQTHSASSEVTVRMSLARGDIVASDLQPPLLPYPDRVPMTPAHRRGVLDPASALLMPALARGGPTDPANCNRTLPVFDGGARFNVVLTYAETLPVEKPGYSGPVLVCKARYVPVAGHRADRPGVKFMQENQEMSVWLAPVEGARVLMPLRISVLTMFGTNVIEATRWAAAAGATNAAAPAARPSGGGALAAAGADPR